MSFLHKNVENLNITHELDIYSRDLNIDFTLSNSLCPAVELSNNADTDKYGYSDYGIGFHACSQNSWYGGSWGKDVVISGVDNSSSVHLDNKKRYFSSWCLVNIQHKN